MAKKKPDNEIIDEIISQQKHPEHYLRDLPKDVIDEILHGDVFIINDEEE